VAGRLTYGIDWGLDRHTFQYCCLLRRVGAQLGQTWDDDKFFFYLGFGTFWHSTGSCSVLVARHRKESSSGRDSPTESLLTSPAYNSETYNYNSRTSDGTIF
jgi:hypothetical protein